MSRQFINANRAKFQSNAKNKICKNVVKNKQPKKKCVCCSRILRPDESLEKIVANERMIFLSKSIHPPVILGHKNCIQAPLKTPKNQGFMLDIEKYGVSRYL